MYEELIAKLRDHNACISIKTLDKAADAIEELSREVKSLYKILGTHLDPKGKSGEPGVPPKEET